MKPVLKKLHADLPYYHKTLFHRLSKIKTWLNGFNYFARPNGIHPGGPAIKSYK